MTDCITGRVEQCSERTLLKHLEMQCEETAEEITEKVKKFVRNKKEVQSIEIRKKIESELKKKNEELAFFYEQHLPNLKKLQNMAHIF